LKNNSQNKIKKITVNLNLKNNGLKVNLKNNGQNKFETCFFLRSSLKSPPDHLVYLTLGKQYGECKLNFKLSLKQTNRQVAFTSFFRKMQTKE